MSQRIRTSQSHMITTPPRWNGSLPSPRELLGAGRVDPFLSYPTRTPDLDVPELLDVEMNYVLPTLFPDDHPQHGASSVNSTSIAWFSAGIKNPFLFNVLLWSACCHRDFLRGSEIQYDSPQALSYKVNSIRLLNEVLSDGRKAITDEVILTVMGLAAHEILTVTQQNPKPFNSPLKDAGGMAFYSATKDVPEHMEAIKKLIALRGGLENLKLPGLAETFHIGCISKTLNFSVKSIFPPLRSHGIYIASLKEWAATLLSPAQVPAKAFRRLARFGISDSMFESFQCIDCLTMATEHYLEGKPDGLTLGQIVRTRLAVQKRLLMLPTAEELRYDSETILSAKRDLYECCRLTAIIFSVAVIFPTPNQFGVLQTLVRGLKAELEQKEIHNNDLDYSELLLWILVLGGIAALGKSERPWFVSHLKVVGLERLQIHNWDSAEHILKQFLWLDSACNGGGHQLWEEVKILREEK
ncbi:hypothetical protein N431DRAFT_405887 [Stipitochalara longipes BDJ]|nr:hypothetical protein N431DRAFT_405887 [Stipitochalara longipes BDJ]